VTRTGQRAVIYARVSQDRDGKSTSVDQQLADCRKFAEERGFDVVAELWDNDISAYTGKLRPQYNELLRMIRDGETDVVIVWEQSRLTRRPYELEGYIEACEPRSVATHSVTAGALDLTTSQGRMVARITGAVNRQEVEQLIGRVKRGLRTRAATGKPVGGRRPFGFLPDKVTHEPREAAAIRDATQKIVAGESLHGIARQWRAEGLLTTTGQEWSTTQLRTLLRRARNAGLRQHAGHIVGPGTWEPIVPVDLWTACVAVLDNPIRRTTTGNQPAYLGTFIYRCGAIIDGRECGEFVKSWSSGGRSADRETNREARAATRIYRCVTKDRNGIRHVTVPIAPADEYVADYVINGIHELGFGLPPDPDTAPPVSTSETVAELEARLGVQARLFNSGLLPEAAYVEAVTMIGAQLEQAQQATAVPIRQVTNEVFDLAHERSRWEDLTLERRRALISSVAKVTILPIGSGVRAPISDRVRVELDLSQWQAEVIDAANTARAEREVWESENPQRPVETLLEYLDRGPE
jgi:site-specific DNA recombinase